MFANPMLPKVFCGVIAGLIYAPHCLSAESEISTTIAWDQNYVSEGRENLDGDGLYSIAADASFAFGPGNLIAGAWHAEADDSDLSYNELNLYIGYAHSFEYFDAALAFTRLEFLSDDEFDNEISLALSKTFENDVTLGLDSIYSTEAEGTFFEAYVSYEKQITDRWTLGSTLLLGVNQGYVADEHDGLNNVQLVLESSYALTEQLSFNANIGYTMGLEEEPEDSLDDIFFGGIALTYTF